MPDSSLVNGHNEAKAYNFANHWYYICLILFGNVKELLVAPIYWTVSYKLYAFSSIN